MVTAGIVTPLVIISLGLAVGNILLQENIG
jgi:hypothetical protein